MEEVRRTPTFLELWSQNFPTEPNGETLAVSTVISRRLLQGAQRKMAEQILAMMERALARGGVRRGMLPLKASFVEEDDPILKLQQVYAYMDGPVRPLLVAYIEELEGTLLDAMRQVDRPWWSLLWLKLRYGIRVDLPWMKAERVAAQAEQADKS